MPSSAPSDVPGRVSLWSAFSQDRWLAGLTAAASLLVLFPLTQTPILPLTDLPNHSALASQVGHLLSGDTVARHHFMLQPHPSPYWVMYLMMLGLSLLVGPLMAAKLVVALALLIVPLGLMRLLLAMGRSPWMALWAFALSWEFSLSFGFVAFSLTTGLAFLYASFALEWATKRSVRIWGVLALGILISTGHAHAAGTCTILVFALAAAEIPDKKKAFRLVALSALPTLGLIPWMLLGPGAGEQEMPASIGDFPPISERVGRLFTYSMDLVTAKYGQNAMGLAFVILLLGPLLLAQLNRSRRSGPGVRGPLFLYAAGWALFLLMPATLYWPFFQLLIYERHATLVLLLGLTLPDVRAEGMKRLLFVPGLLAVGLSAIVVAIQCREFGTVVRPFLAILDAIEPGSRLNSMLWTRRTPESVRDTLVQVPAYIVAVHGGYSPDLFQTPNLPVRYIDSAHPPHHVWHQPGAFNATLEAPHFDYLLVQGKEHDRVRAGVYGKGKKKVRITKKVESGLWRLYAVEPVSPPPSSSSATPPVPDRSP